MTESKANRAARLAAAAPPAPAPETPAVDPKAPDRKADADAAALRRRDEERGYEAAQWSGRDGFRPIGGGDLWFDTERDAIEWVAQSRVRYNLTGGVTA